MPNTKKIAQEFMFDTDVNQVFAGMAFDGDYFYLLEQSGDQVVKYNRCFEYIEDIALKRSYSCICQDCDKGSFWAASKECPNILFYLNRNFQEIREIHILPPNNRSGYITGLSANCRRRTLLVAYTWGVLELNPDTEAFSMQYEAAQGMIQGVLSIYPGSIMIQTVSGRQNVIVLNPYQQVSKQQQIPPNSMIGQLLYCPCKDEPMLYCLVTQNGEKTKVVTQKLSLQSLGFAIDSCYYQEAVAAQEPVAVQEPELVASETECHSCSVPPFNLQNVLEEFTKTCAPEVPLTCQKPQIMESVALSGAAISHILNAEGEKLQKVLACTDDISTILCVNKSVSQTIIQITQLEQIMYNKLLLVENQCCDCEKCKPPCPKPCNECKPPCKKPCDECRPPCPKPCDECRPPCPKPCDECKPPCPKPCDECKPPCPKPCDECKPPCDECRPPCKRPCDECKSPCDSPCGEGGSCDECGKSCCRPCDECKSRCAEACCIRLCACPCCRQCCDTKSP